MVLAEAVMGGGGGGRGSFCLSYFIFFILFHILIDCLLMLITSIWPTPSILFIESSNLSI
jgi:hypothetical protein